MLGEEVREHDAFPESDEYALQMKLIRYTWKKKMKTARNKPMSLWSFPVAISSTTRRATPAPIESICSMSFVNA
jgi:hypothetical protein